MGNIMGLGNRTGIKRHQDALRYMLHLATLFFLEVLGVYDHCYCMRLPGNSQVSLAVMTLPAADSWVQGLEAQAARYVVPIVPV